MNSGQLIISLLGAILLLLLFEYLPEPHNHFLGDEVRLNPKLHTRPVLCVQDGDTMSVFIDTGKHIPYENK